MAKKKSWRKNKEFVCPECGKDFDEERKLKLHKKDSHGKNTGRKSEKTGG